MRSSVIALFGLGWASLSHGQTADPRSGGGNYFGFGIGLEHGGIGVRADVRPIPELGAFAGAGYAFAGIGWNLGFVCRPWPEHKVVPYLTAMYGYNTAYVLKDRRSRTTVDSDIYFGPSFGGGVEFMKKDDAAFWRIGLLLPVRSDQVEKDHADAYRDLWPVLLSVGYHIRM